MSNAQRMDQQEVGRRIGFDLVRYGRGPVDGSLPAPIREGIADARGQGVAARAPDRFVGKWLQVRLNAFRRQRIVDERVTPSFLQRIDVTHCPVTRCALTHGALLPTDWSIDRLNNDGAYAPSNLAVISTAANAAKGDRSFDEVLDRSRVERATEGLEPVQWLRLAVLMLGPCHVERASRAPLLPLVAPLPPLTPRPIAQVVQHVFTTMAVRQSGCTRLVRHFRPACPPASHGRLERFTDRLHHALKHADAPCDAWLDPRLMEAFVAWRHTLDPQAWSDVGRMAGALVGGHRTGVDAIRAWHLDRHGYSH